MWFFRMSESGEPLFERFRHEFEMRLEVYRTTGLLEWENEK